MKILFFYPQILVRDFQNRYKITMSMEFIQCADQQLTKIFEQQTGLRINKEISVSTVAEWAFFTESGIISKFPLFIYVNHNWNPVTIPWHSKSGRVYQLANTNIIVAILFLVLKA